MKQKFFKTRIALALAALGSSLAFVGPAHAVVSDVAVFRALPMVVVWGADNFAELAPTGNPVASDLVLLGGASGTAGSDIVAGNVFPVITGTTNPASNLSALTSGTLVTIANPAAAPAGGGVLTDNATVGALNAADALTAFGVQATTSVGFSGGLTRSFYVSSNAQFDIFAQSGAVTATGDWSAFTAADVSITALGITVSGTDSGLAFGASAQTPTTGGTGFVATPIALNTLAAATKIYDGGRRTASAAGSLTAQSVRFDITYNLSTAYGFHRGAGSVSVPMTYSIYNP